MKPIRNLEEDNVRMPYWKTDKKDIILKVKDKFVNYSDDLESGCLYTAHLVFEFYSIGDLYDGQTLKGYCLKVQGLIKPKMEVDVRDAEYN